MSMGSTAERLDNVQTMRRKDQARRRAQLIDAARALLLEHGALGLRVKDIAARAGISSSAVLYYYPDLDDLLLEVTREAMSRYAERRAEAIRGLADPARQLRVAISLGVPTGPDDEDSRLLYELDAMTGASKLFATLSAAFFDRQVMLYERVLERGVDSGAFDAGVRSAHRRSRPRRAGGRARTPGRARPPGGRRGGRRGGAGGVGERGDRRRAAAGRRRAGLSPRPPSPACGGARERRSPRR